MLSPLYKKVPVQMCHYNQNAIITRYLTLRSRLEAGIELRKLAQGLCDEDEASFALELAAWHEKWQEFLKERTTNPERGKWHYMHKRLRPEHTKFEFLCKKPRR